MDIALTSFGIGMKEGPRLSPFHRLPPLYLGRYSLNFHIDYAALFLFDRLIVDEVSYNKALAPDFSEWRHYPSEMLEAVKKGALEYAAVLKSLEKEGRLITKNFDELHARARPLIDKALERDLKKIPYWTKPIEESMGQWMEVIYRIREPLMSKTEERRLEIPENEARDMSLILHVLHGAHGASFGDFLIDCMKKWKEKLSPKRREICREMLSDYLAYINFNLILAFECKSVFTDWHDMQPLYAAKFKAAPEAEAVPDDHGGKVLAQGRKLFDFMFPFFTPKSNKDLLKAVDDKRVVKLREIVIDAYERGAEFDSATCTSILRNVLRLENRSILRRKITGWATLPLGIIPVLGTGIQKGAEELINALWADRPLKKYSWFYLLNELDASLDDDPFRWAQDATWRPNKPK